MASERKLEAYIDNGYFVDVGILLTTFNFVRLSNMDVSIVIPALVERIRSHLFSSRFRTLVVKLTMKLFWWMAV